MLNLLKRSTNINEVARRSLGISRDEYALCAYVQYRGADPRNTKPGWCCDAKQDIADFIGVTRPGLYGMVNKMDRFGLLNCLNSQYQVTEKWIDAEQEHNGTQEQTVNKVHTDCKESLHNDVNKVYTDCKESLQSSIIGISKRSKNIVREIDISETGVSETADQPNEGSNILHLEAKEKKEKVFSGGAARVRSARSKQEGAAEPWTKRVAQIFDQVNEEMATAHKMQYMPYEWKACPGRDFKSLKEIKGMIEGAVRQKRGDATPEMLEQGFRAFFGYGFEYLNGIAEKLGGATQFSPQALQRNYNAIRQFAMNRKEAAPRQPTPQPRKIKGPVYGN